MTLRRTHHLLKNLGMLENTKFEAGANSSELDKDTDRNNLNSRVKYLSLVLPLNILFLLLVFIGLNTCKAIVNDGLLFFPELHVLDIIKT